MTPKDWIQLAFGLSNGLSFALTFRHAAWAKIAGSCVLLVAHPGIAAYFLVTGQPFFLVGNVIMTAAGLYGLVRGLRMRAARPRASAAGGDGEVPEGHRDHCDGCARLALRRAELVERLDEALDNTPH